MGLRRVHSWQVFLTTEHLAIVMEYAPGGDMFKFVESRGGIPVSLPRMPPFPVREAITVKIPQHSNEYLSLTNFLYRVSSTNVMKPNVLRCRFKGTNPPSQPLCFQQEKVCWFFQQTLLNVFFLREDKQ
jgi:hypothetical protein